MKSIYRGKFDKINSDKHKKLHKLLENIDEKYKIIIFSLINHSNQVINKNIFLKLSNIDSFKKLFFINSFIKEDYIYMFIGLTTMHWIIGIFYYRYSKT